MSIGIARADRLRSLGRRLLTSGVVLLVLGVALSASATPVPYRAHAAVVGGPGGSATVRLNVTATDAPAFVPRTLNAIAGSSVTFNVTNLGNYTHTFSLSGVANRTLDTSWSPAQLYAFFAKNGTSVNVTVAPATTVNVTFGIPASWVGGSFEFVSLVPYQFQAGMLGYLNVTSASTTAGFVVQETTASAGLAFVPSILQVNATSFPVTIRVDVSNAGTTAHSWTLDAQPNENLTPTGFASYFQAHAPAANVIVPTTVGVVASANVTLGQKGVYEFICTVPGHFAAGMYGYLYVGVAAPAPAAPPSNAIVQLWVLVAAGVLLSVGALLSIAAAFAGRFAASEKNPHHP